MGQEGSDSMPLINLLAIGLLSVLNDPSPTTIVPEPALGIESTGSRWRRPVHTDALESAIVNGTWRAPTEGTTLQHPDGTTLTWKILEPDDKGRVTGPRGGYVYYRFESDQAGPALLESRGHSLCYINGQPRGGDVYNRGTLRLPFMMKQGTNEFLFRSGRGPIRPVVHLPEAVAEAEMSHPAEQVAFIGTNDPTLPDLVQGEALEGHAAVLIYNINEEPLRGVEIQARTPNGLIANSIGTIQPLSFLKVPLDFSCTAPETLDKVPLRLTLLSNGTVLDEQEFQLVVKAPDDLHRRTFVSKIDGSVQYYAVRPAVPDEEADELKPGIALSLHGASVEARGQAACYRPRSWVHVVAPTNRRPFGFDWEHWGRRDAMEVLADASSRYANDPSRRWLTGHSMGGHGTWQLGATLPDQWAAIAPSAGWVSFWTYGGPERYARDGGVEEILHRAANPSETLLMKDNLDDYGIYILHGDADNNVPVEQARIMRGELADFHGDWTYYERPGAGHWWGNQCMDWPPLFEFIKQRTLPDPETIDEIDFTTVDPRASATSSWATIEAQDSCLEPSQVSINRDRAEGMITGTTRNVRRLSLDVSHLPVELQEITLELDGQTLSADRPSSSNMIHLSNADGQWSLTEKPSLDLKGPHRGSGFRDAFNNNVILVYGTAGSDEETARNAAQARLDSERFWYRGNGHLPFVPDSEFDPKADPDRNVIVYGNADTHTHWNTLVGSSPLQIERGSLKIGSRSIEGDDMAAVFIRPRPHSDVASVGVVAGTGPSGDRLSDQMPFFFAGVGWPDWFILQPDALMNGTDGVVATGFFDDDWSIDLEQMSFGRRLIESE
ncbi:MAG: hypothetical protein CMJ39_08550 [Phycisphaerae bacterium]|nr:hypothetical protein [Phycisphaerae bacterium]